MLEHSINSFKGFYEIKKTVIVYNIKNKKYLDFSAGIAVNTLGYNHPLIKKVLKEQLKTGILHLSGSQLHKYKILLSSLLSIDSVRRPNYTVGQGISDESKQQLTQTTH